MVDGVRDEAKFNFYSERVGCTDLWEAVKRVRPKFHVFGHIHADYGRTDNEPTTGCTFLNACIMNERYDPENKPLEFEL
jgi:Icc-related predicted phosphoesterase